MRCAATVALLLLASAVWSQTPALRRRQHGPLPVAATAKREVIFDAVVREANGQPARGLKATDFHLSEDGVSQTIVSVVEHGLSEKAAAEEKTTPPHLWTNRPGGSPSDATTVIVLDQMDGPDTDEVYEREEILEFLKTVPPAARIAIFSLDTGVWTIQPMTTTASDLVTLRAALRLPRRGSAAPAELTDPSTSALRRKKLREDIFRDGMGQIEAYWKSFPGRRNLIWLTGQVPVDLAQSGPDDVFADESEIHLAEGERTEIQRLSRVAVYPVDTLDLPQGQTLSGIGTRNRSSAGSLTRDKEIDPKPALTAVALGTGGAAFFPKGRLRATLAQAVDLGLHFYTVTYRPAKPADGAFHALHLQTVQKGMTVAARSGYVAQPIGSVKEPVPLSDVHARVIMQAALVAGAVPPNDIVFQVEMKPPSEVRRLPTGDVAMLGNSMDQGQRRKGYRVVELDYHIEAGKMVFGRAADGTYPHVTLCEAVLYDATGRRVNGIESRITANLDQKSYERTLRDGIALPQRIGIPAKGHFTLRMAVIDPAGPVIGVIETQLDGAKLP